MVIKSNFYIETILMKKQFIKTIIVVLSLNLLIHITAFAQNKSVTVSVKDENGKPVSGALITIGEGENQIITNENGEVSFTAMEQTSVLIEADGYETQLVSASPPLFMIDPVVMLKLPIRMGEKDIVNVPFGILTNRQLTGAVSTIDAKEILRFDQVEGYREAINGRITGMFGSNNIRGKDNPLIIVDGFPREADEINPQQIEQITVLKDVASGMLYGSQASNGVILITTKRGSPMKKMLQFKADMEYQMPISYPEYLSSTDYMRYYNEALGNDGLTPVYTDEAISKTISGKYPTSYPDEDFYNSTYLKDWTTSYNVVGEASGGNEIAQYYLNLGWKRDNSLLSLGEGANEKQDRLNLRGNVNYKLNDNISIKFDGFSMLNIENGPRYTGSDFWELASSLKPNFSPVLIPGSMVLDSVLLSSAKLIDNQYLLGGTSVFPNNPYGELTNNGSRTFTSVLLQMNLGIDFKLDFITKGLTATGYLSFDIYNSFNNLLQNTYAVYNPTFLNDSTISTATKIGEDVKQTDKTVNNPFFYNRIGFYGGLNYQRIFNSIHEVNGKGIVYLDQFRQENQLQPNNHLHFGVQANYIYDKKYLAELTSVVAGSSRLYGSTRYAFSPGIGLGWVLSEENFLKDKTIFNYLKLRTNFAVNHSDENIGYFLYMPEYYTQGARWNYNKGANYNNAQNAFIGNTNLNWEKTTEFNLGFESEILSSKLRIEASYFYNKASDLISRRSNYYPAYYSNAIYENFGEEQYTGFELGVDYTEKFDDLTVTLGANVVYSVPKTNRVDELNYSAEYDYLNKTGKPSDALFGYVAMGLFKDSADIIASPLQTFGTVRPGDIKYEDLNNDGKIDNLDVKMIGNSQSRIGYGVNIKLKYKAFMLYALGTGQSGAETYYKNDYYWVYGTGKYSEVVLNAWTPQNASTADYPRLSTIESSNNFRNSSYWLYQLDWFKIHTLQLNYQLNKKTGNLKEANFYIRGNNLATFSKEKDKMELNIGSMPQTRQFTIGFTANF